MKDLIDYDIYYKGKLINNILEYEITSYKLGEIRLHVSYINDNKYKTISDLINEFEFKEKTIETSVYEVYSLAKTLTQQYIGRDGINNSDIISYLKKTHPNIVLL